MGRGWEMRVGCGWKEGGSGCCVGELVVRTVVVRLEFGWARRSAVYNNLERELDRTCNNACTKHPRGRNRRAKKPSLLKRRPRSTIAYIRSQLPERLRARNYPPSFEDAGLSKWEWGTRALESDRLSCSEDYRWRVWSGKVA